MRSEKEGAEYPDHAVRATQAGEAGDRSALGDMPIRSSRMAIWSLCCGIASWLVLGGIFCISKVIDDFSAILFVVPGIFAVVVFSVLSLLIGVCAIIKWGVALLFRTPRSTIWQAWVGIAMSLAFFLWPYYGWIGIFLKTGTRLPFQIYISLDRTKSQHDLIVEKLEDRYRKYGEYHPWKPMSARKNQIDAFDTLPSEIANLPTFEFTDYQSEHRSDLNLHPAQFGDYFTPSEMTRGRLSYGYYTTSIHDASTSATGYIVWSCGPDRKYDLNASNIESAYRPGRKIPSDYLVERIYDPSNGAVSGGDIVRYKK